jgi:hypothetical protein
MGETVVIWFSVVVSLEVKIQRDWSATPSRSQFATRRVLAYVEVRCNVLPRALGRHIERPDPAARFSYAHVAIR